MLREWYLALIFAMIVIGVQSAGPTKAGSSVRRLLRIFVTKEWTGQTQTLGTAVA